MCLEGASGSKKPVVDETEKRGGGRGDGSTRAYRISLENPTPMTCPVRLHTSCGLVNVHSYLLHYTVEIIIITFINPVRYQDDLTSCLFLLYILTAVGIKQTKKIKSAINFGSEIKSHTLKGLKSF